VSIGTITLCVAYQRVFIVVVVDRLSPENFGYNLVSCLLWNPKFHHCVHKSPPTRHTQKP
jgi:hypothetical protein